MSEEKRQHLQFIQQRISTLERNSFVLKIIVILLLSVDILFHKSMHLNPGPAGAIPAIALWCLDSYFVQMSWKWQGLFKDVAGLTDRPIRDYDLSLSRYNTDEYSFKAAFVEKNTMLVYLIAVVLFILSGILNTR